MASKKVQVSNGRRSRRIVKTPRHSYQPTKPERLAKALGRPVTVIERKPEL